MITQQRDSGLRSQNAPHPRFFLVVVCGVNNWHTHMRLNARLIETPEVHQRLYHVASVCLNGQQGAYLQLGVSASANLFWSKTSVRILPLVPCLG